MVGERHVGGKDRVDGLHGRLRLFHVRFLDGHTTKERCHGRERGIEITQQAFQATQRDGSENPQVLISWSSTLGISSNCNQTMQVMEDRLDGPGSISRRLHGLGIFNDVMRRLLATRDNGGHAISIERTQNSVLGRGIVQGGTKLTKALELVDKFVENVKDPLGRQEELGVLQGSASIFGVHENFVKEFTVDIPSFDAVLNRGARHGVPVTVGQFAVNCQEERISVAFRGNGVWGRPGSVAKVLCVCQNGVCGK